MHISGVPLISLLLALACGSAALHAQELSLFEPVDSAVALDQLDPAQLQPQRNLPGVPVFTLVGISRFGDQHRVTLSTGNGEVVQVALTPGQPQAIPDYPVYRVEASGARSVTVSASGGMSCIPDAGRGINCGTDGTMQLTLTTAAPIAVATQSDGDQAAADTAAAPTGAPDNPFAAALRAAAQNEANGQRGARAAERFEARRIAPEDVPPGMRVVRTPFGDRLVEL